MSELIRKSVIWNDQILFSRETPNADVCWWAVSDIKSEPDWWDPKLLLHSKSDCCSGFMRKVYSFFLIDHAGRGVRAEAHYGFCADCGRKLSGALPHAKTKDGLEAFVFYFGKHKGRRMADIPKDYLVWCSENLRDEKIKKKIQAYLSHVHQS